MGKSQNPALLTATFPQAKRFKGFKRVTISYKGEYRLSEPLVPQYIKLTLYKSNSFIDETSNLYYSVEVNNVLIGLVFDESKLQFKDQRVIGAFVKFDELSDQHGTYYKPTLLLQYQDAQ